MTTPTTDTQPPGPGVDAQGRSVIDPTANVLAVVGAAVQRLDDLRLLGLAHVQEMATLRAEYEDKLRGKESERIDAIRAVDVNAVQRAAEVQAAQALTLQAQVATSAEAMRAQVAAAANAAAAALSASLEPVQKSIDDLRKTQYEQQGQKAAQSEGRDLGQWIVGAVIAAAAVVATLAAGGHLK